MCKVEAASQIRIDEEHDLKTYFKGRMEGCGE
jgi:hypothetical protein